MTNGYYVWPKVQIVGNGLRESVSRKYMTVDQTDAAIKWIERRSRSGGQRPWMCTVSYNAAHTQYQQPPSSLTPGSEDLSDCAIEIGERELNDLMIQAMDEEISRLLVETGLALMDGDRLELQLDAANTVLIVVGDNGSYLPVVREPFNPARSKGTCYQTGVWCPLIIAGPSDIVAQPGRAVDHMVSGVDLFELFGELAGLDVRSVVPSSHVLDSKPMLPYLADPDQPSIRRFNFSQLGIGDPDPSDLPGPCVLFDNVTCDDILFTTKELCVANGGTWYGDGADGGLEFNDCCELLSSGVVPDMPVLPPQTWTIRNEDYKLLKIDLVCCKRGPECPEQGVYPGTFELYRLDTALRLDDSENELLGGECPSEAGLSEEELANFIALRQALDELLASEIRCHGDGNLDKRVDMQDLVGVMQNFGVPSVFDVNSDGTTDGLDQDCVLMNLGITCTADDPGVPCVGSVGACHLPSGACEITSESACHAAGGLYQGDGTSQCCADSSIR